MTAAQIEHEAIRLFREHGYASTTVPMIAAASGVGRTTVFRYWSSKADLVWGEFYHHLDRLRVGLEAMPADDPLDCARQAAVGALRDSIAATPNWMDRFELIEESVDLQAESALLWHRWAELISRFLSERTGRPRHDPAIGGSAGAFQGVFVSTLRTWRTDDGEAAGIERLDYDLTIACECLRPWLERPPYFGTGYHK